MKRPQVTRTAALVAGFALGELLLLTGVAMFSIAIALILAGVQLVAGAVSQHVEKGSQ